MNKSIILKFQFFIMKKLLFSEISDVGTIFEEFAFSLISTEILLLYILY